MGFTKQTIETLAGAADLPVYVFNEQGFLENLHSLTGAMSGAYPLYRVAYSFKTNYTPYIISVVKGQGGYAEVVSEMEYTLAQRLQFPAGHIIFNGPEKGTAGTEAFLAGCLVNADSFDELKGYCAAAAEHGEKDFKVGLRINIDVGQGFVSRFGIDPAGLAEVFQYVRAFPNVKIAGIQCHISRCRGLDAWRRRTETMLRLADTYFETAPEYIDLGSGMFGSMAPEFAAQFSNVPSYSDYTSVTARMVNDHYQALAPEKKPVLFTEPGTTLVNRYVDFVARVQAIKQIRGKTFAVLNCSIHNLGETCTLKKLPFEIIPCGAPQVRFDSADFSGYTCLEQDIMLTAEDVSLAVGDFIVFGNVGGYSNVLKPPFIRPNCAMLALPASGRPILIKRPETFRDIFGTYSFPDEVIS